MLTSLNKLVRDKYYHLTNVIIWFQQTGGSFIIQKMFFKKKIKEIDRRSHAFGHRLTFQQTQSCVSGGSNGDLDADQFIRSLSSVDGADTRRPQTQINNTKAEYYENSSNRSR